MQTSAKPLPPRIQELVQKVRSDDLPKIAAMLQRLPVPGAGAEMYQVDVILDANIVIRELLWLARKRTNPTARTDLMEVMDCNVVRAHAPFFLVREINVNLPEVAAEHGIALKSLRVLWKDYRKRIRLVAVGGPAKNLRDGDPKDAPYLRLQRKLSYPIASNDADIARMGGRVVQAQLFGTLRAYSRHAAVEFHFKMSGAGSLLMLCAMVEAGVAIVTKLPKPLLLLGAAAFTFAMIHPTSRKKILELGAGILGGGAALFEHAIIPMLDAHGAAGGAARVSLDKAQAALAAGTVVQSAPTAAHQRRPAG